MKATRFFAIAAFAGALLFSCKSEIEPETVNTPAVSGEFTVSIEAVKNVDTKALALSADGKSLSATWEDGDQVAVCRIDPERGDLSTILGILSPTEFGSATTTLTGTLLLDGVAAGDKLYLQHPFQVFEATDGSRWLDSPYRGQDGDLVTVGKEFAYASCGVDITSLEGGALSTSKASFYNRQAIVKFSLQNAGSPLEASKLRVFAPSLSDHFYHDDYYVYRGGLDVIASAPRSEFTVALRNQDTEHAEPYTLFAVSGSNVYTATTSYLLFADGSYNRGTGNLTPISYAGFETDSPWSVIGILTEYEVSWNNDLNMWTDGNGWHVAADVKLKAGDQFKFRKNLDWGFNLGGSFKGQTTTSAGYECGLITSTDAFGVDPDGLNILVPADGTYDIYLDESTLTAMIVPASGAGKVSTLVTTPEPPAPVTGWNIIGLYGNWTDDVLATENPAGVWTAEVTITENTSFKWRKDAGWDDEFGGTMVEYGTPFAAVSGGPNIDVEPGFCKIVLDLTDSSAPTITVYRSTEVWSLIGEFSGWSGDVDMDYDEVSGKWVSPPTAMSGIFKIRKNHDWEVNRGASGDTQYDVTLGTAFDVVQNGQNLALPADLTYVVTYDPTAETILVEEYKPVATKVTYTVAGTSNVFGSNWNPEDTENDMVYDEGKWYLTKNYVNPCEFEFKVVRNHSFSDASWPADNYKYTITGTDVVILTIAFDPSDGSITVSEVVPPMK